MDDQHLSNVGWICSAVITVAGFLIAIYKQHYAHKQTHREICENREISKDAFTAANSFNEKIARINNRLLNIESDFVPGRQLMERLDGIDRRLEDLQKRFRE